MATPEQKIKTFNKPVRVIVAHVSAKHSAKRRSYLALVIHFIIHLISQRMV
jgi:hypothetical protein